MRCLRSKVEGWCGYCYSARRGRAGHPGQRRQNSPVRALTELEWIMAMSRPKDNARETAGRQVVDEVLKGWLPDLHAFLTEQEWEDKKKRVTGTIMVMCEDGLWKAWVHDRDLKVTGWVSNESWEGLLEALNRALGSNSIEWRVAKR